ncbi:MAG: hypothetical protein E7H57_05790 [Pantoea sp.]|nr:hypothetical protein [Pantoea sp.]
MKISWVKGKPHDYKQRFRVSPDEALNSDLLIIEIATFTLQQEETASILYTRYVFIPYSR